MGTTDIDRVVTVVAATEPSVVAAWVFGSRGRGEARPGSDLDVAILTDGSGGGIVDRIAAEIAVRCSHVNGRGSSCRLMRLMARPVAEGVDP